MPPTPAPSPSLSWVASQGGSITIACRQGDAAAARKLGVDCCPIHRVSGPLAVERWGSETTIVKLQRGLRCLVCRGAVRIEIQIAHQTGPTPPEPFVGIRSCYGDPWANGAVPDWQTWDAKHGRA